MKYELIAGKDFNNKVPFYDIDCIAFTNEVAPNEVELTDLSNDRDESIVGWKEDDGIYKVSTQEEEQKILFNENCIEMFANRKELQSSDLMSDFMVSVESVENRLRVARDNYNEAVQEYNTTIRKFPNSIIAGVGGFEKMDKYQASTEAQNAPKVEFNSNK